MRISQRVSRVVLAVVLVVGLAADAVAQAAAVTFQAAAARGAISFQFEGMGGSSGASVRVKVKRNPGAPDPLPVTIPPGTVLRSSSAGTQSMVVSSLLGVDLGGGSYRPTSRLLLRGAEMVTAILSAFCAEFEKDNPSPSTTFAIEPPDPLQACIARESESRNLSVAAQQAAVWMVTDRIFYCA